MLNTAPSKSKRTRSRENNRILCFVLIVTLSKMFTRWQQIFFCTAFVVSTLLIVVFFLVVGFKLIPVSGTNLAPSNFSAERANHSATILEWTPQTNQTILT